MSNCNSQRFMSMKQETISVLSWASGRPKQVGIVLSLRRSSAEDCDVVIGYPGLPNVTRTMTNGDATLFETTHDGIVEVRAIALYPSRVDFLVTQVSPRGGFIAGAVEVDPNNAPFDEIELRRVAESVSEVKKELSRRNQASPEHLDLLFRKLDEIQNAAGRMGRKDWINYVAGALTSTCISAAFAPDVTKSIFLAVNSAFIWLFANGMLLLQHASA